MKKAHFLLFALVTFVGFEGLAQGEVRVGGGLVYGTEIESLGINFRGDYALTEEILLAPDLVYFFPNDEFGIDFKWFDINLNGNYLFTVSNEGITPYALAGLNIAILSVDLNNVPGFRGGGNSTEIGLNVGGGADFHLGGFDAFGELRYAIGNDQLVIGGGLKFPIN